jgi:hypothetical protein
LQNYTFGIWVSRGWERGVSLSKNGMGKELDAALHGNTIVEGEKLSCKKGGKVGSKERANNATPGRTHTKWTELVRL